MKTERGRGEEDQKQVRKIGSEGEKAGRGRKKEELQRENKRRTAVKGRKAVS